MELEAFRVGQLNESRVQNSFCRGREVRDSTWKWEQQGKPAFIPPNDTRRAPLPHPHTLNFERDKRIHISFVSYFISKPKIQSYCSCHAVKC